MKRRISPMVALCACVFAPACADTETREDRKTALRPHLDGLSDEQVVVKSAAVSDATIKQWLKQTP
jgi:hypothetical protein